MTGESENDSMYEFDPSRYPVAFFADYEALFCLSDNENAETLLVSDRKTQVQYLAKCYLGENRPSGVSEAALLKKLNYPGIPKFVSEYENETMLCVVRDYIVGLPLNDFVEQTPPSPEQSVDIASQICDILAYLHRQTPPIIHRDIKPQNIIIDSENKVWLIDYGISREYDPAANKDTTCFGTVDFAPPEQYGFSQTDNRTDIFSLGVLIGWLLTGESQPRKALPKLESSRLKKIVQTCTELTPDRRYATADKVKKALQHADGHIQRRILRITCCLAASLLCFIAGFSVGRNTDYTLATLIHPGVSFEEPLIEKAVRLSLGKKAGEPIYKEDLTNVTALYIFGDQAVGNDEAYAKEHSRMTTEGQSLINGGIQSLNDLKQMIHLKTIRIALQEITDISALSKLTMLEVVDLNHNPIESVAPLASVSSLRDLSVYDSRVSDFTALSPCHFLENIDAGRSWVTSIQAFAGITSLKQLILRQSALSSIQGIESLAGLERVGFSSVEDHNLKPLAALPRLQEVYLDEALRENAAQDLPDPDFRIIFS